MRKRSCTLFFEEYRVFFFFENLSHRERIIHLRRQYNTNQGRVYRLERELATSFTSLFHACLSLSMSFNGLKRASLLLLATHHASTIGTDAHADAHATAIPSVSLSFSSRGLSSPEDDTKRPALVSRGQSRDGHAKLRSMLRYIASSSSTFRVAPSGERNVIILLSIFKNEITWTRVSKWMANVWHVESFYSFKVQSTTLHIHTCIAYSLLPPPPPSSFLPENRKQRI